MSKKQFVVDIPDIKVTRVCSIINNLLNYNGYLNPIDNKAVVDLELQSVKKY